MLGGLPGGLLFGGLVFGLIGGQRFFQLSLKLSLRLLTLWLNVLARRRVPRGRCLTLARTREHTRRSIEAQRERWPTIGCNTREPMESAGVSRGDSSSCRPTRERHARRFGTYSDLQIHAALAAMFCSRRAVASALVGTSKHLAPHMRTAGPARAHQVLSQAAEKLTSARRVSATTKQQFRRARKRQDAHLSHDAPRAGGLHRNGRDRV